MARRNTENEAVGDESVVELGAPVLPPGLTGGSAVEDQPVEEQPAEDQHVDEQPADEQPADAGSDREPDPTPAPDRSELVLAAIRRGIPSYRAWAMTDDELTGRQEA